MLGSLLVTALLRFGCGLWALAATECRPRNLEGLKEKNAGSPIGRIGDFEIIDGGPEGLVDGTKIRNRKTGRVCDGSPGITRQMFQSDDGKKYLSFDYSGSTETLSVIDLETCAVVARLSFYTEKIFFDQNRLQVTPACECGSRECPVGSCDAGGIYDLGTTCVPQRLPEESAALTKKILGVVFEGNRDVVFPATPKAAVVEKNSAPSQKLR